MVWNSFTCFVRLSFLPNFFSQYLHLYSSPSFSWIVDTCRILFLILTNVFEHSSHWRLSESNVSCEDWICSFRVCFLPKIESQWLHLKRLVLSFLMKLIFSVDILCISWRCLSKLSCLVNFLSHSLHCNSSLVCFSCMLSIWRFKVLSALNFFLHTLHIYSWFTFFVFYLMMGFTN